MQGHARASEACEPFLPIDAAVRNNFCGKCNSWIDWLEAQAELVAEKPWTSPCCCRCKCSMTQYLIWKNFAHLVRTSMTPAVIRVWFCRIWMNLCYAVRDLCNAVASYLHWKKINCKLTPLWHFVVYRMLSCHGKPWAPSIRLRWITWQIRKRTVESSLLNILIEMAALHGINKKKMICWTPAVNCTIRQILKDDTLKASWKHSVNHQTMPHDSMVRPMFSMNL